MEYIKNIAINIDPTLSVIAVLVCGIAIGTFCANVIIYGKDHLWLFVSLLWAICLIILNSF